MARLEAGTRNVLDMTSWEEQFEDAQDVNILDHNNTSFLAQSIGHQLFVTGEDFSYLLIGGTSVVGGTVHGLTMADAFFTNFELTHMHLAATKLMDFVFTNDWTGFQENVFKGNDTIIGSSGGDHLLGWDGKDTIQGRNGPDILSGGGGGDKLTGGNGPDRFDFFFVSESTSEHFDRITDLNAAQDHIGVATTIKGVNDAVSGGTLSKQHFTDDLENLVTGHELNKNHAVLFTPAHGTYKNHTFLIIDANGHGGYQHGEDYLIDVTGIHGALQAGDFVLLAL